MRQSPRIHSPASCPLPRCLAALTYLAFLLFICHYLSYLSLRLTDLLLFPLSVHRPHCSAASFHPSAFPSRVCVGSGPYSCINGTSGFKLLCATCHSSVSASHHCQSIPLTLLGSLSQGPATQLCSAYSQQQSRQCFWELRSYGAYLLYVSVDIYRAE